MIADRYHVKTIILRMIMIEYDPDDHLFMLND